MQNDLYANLASTRFEQDGKGKTPEESIVRGMTQIKPTALTGALVSIPDLRKAVDLPREQFDQALVKLAEAEVAALHRHDFPSSLSKDGRAALLELPAPQGAKVVGQTSDYYIGVALRREAGSVDEVLTRYDQNKENRMNGQQGENETSTRGSMGQRPGIQETVRPYTSTPDGQRVIEHQHAWPNDLSKISLRDLASHAHHEIAPYTSEEVRQIAERDGYPVKTSAEGVGQKGEFDLVSFKGVSGTFVSQQAETVHLSSDFKEAVRDLYFTQETRPADSNRHIYRDLVELDRMVEQREDRERQKQSLQFPIER